MVFLTEHVAINRKRFDTPVFCKFEICLRRLVKKAQGKNIHQTIISSIVFAYILIFKGESVKRSFASSAFVSLCIFGAFVQMTMNTALTNELLIFANFHSDSFSKPEASFQHLCIV
ncbi:hypothetical protein T4B_2718 [Trichinella pseudospiralis]|uniref:Uncharacterized protein n=1 Tax=Trichinella pseudospiralis TaxID=6337 RepID=A0A0V1IZV2_TRIPS|nr:hypothetical protein T4B_2718 [Trichinella pseudospiralis]